MKTASMIVEFTYDDEETSLKTIEKAALHILDRYWTAEVESIVNLEVAPGTLSEAFGIEEIK